jgi:predicted short-subunit dehydrogenase-like oxidoreductase (DUF2520 family)
MLSRCMSRMISIVGAGRVGATLGKRLRKLGWRIGAVVTRTAGTARAARRTIRAGTPMSFSADLATPGISRGPEFFTPSGAEGQLRSHSPARSGALAPEARAVSRIFEADVVLVAVPDAQIARVAASLARIAGRACRGKVVLHTSGALDRTALAPLGRLGAFTGSLHPMQTFTGRGAPNLTGVVFAIEGHPRARRSAAQIARELGGVPVTIEGSGKPAYHAAGALAAGHALALFEAATRILMARGFSRRRAMGALLPLTRQMLENFERHGARAAWTGPIVRGDFAVVAKHAKALRGFPLEFAQAYAALARLSARLLAKNPAPVISRLNRALNENPRR